MPCEKKNNSVCSLYVISLGKDNIWRQKHRHDLVAQIWSVATVDENANQILTESAINEATQSNAWQLLQASTCFKTIYDKKGGYQKFPPTKSEKNNYLSLSEDSVTSCVVLQSFSSSSANASTLHSSTECSPRNWNSLLVVSSNINALFTPGLSITEPITFLCTNIWHT